MDKFDGVIWCGNCGCKCTNSQIVKLHQLIDEAIIHISGMQQAGDDNEATQVDMIAKQVYLALTGIKLVGTGSSVRASKAKR